MLFVDHDGNGVSLADRRRVHAGLHDAFSLHDVENLLQTSVALPFHRGARGERKVIHIGPVAEEVPQAQRTPILRDPFPPNMDWVVMSNQRSGPAATATCHGPSRAR